MTPATKISIRFFNDREVRAVWDDAQQKWYFNVVDVVAVLYEQDDYTKANNYWRWLKRKLGKEQNQLVSATHGFKFLAPDGKKRLADTLDSDGVLALAKHFPNNKAVKFLDWFTYSDNSIDGQSKKRLQCCVDWSKIDKNDYLNAMVKSAIHSTELKSLLKQALTDKINDREIFMKGIDYSYYYEE